MSFIELLRDEYMKEMGEGASLDIWVARLKSPRYVLEQFKKINNGKVFSMQLFTAYEDRHRSLLRMTLQPLSEKVCIIDFGRIMDIQDIASDGRQATFQVYNSQKAQSADGREITTEVYSINWAAEFFEHTPMPFYHSHLQPHPYVLTDVAPEDIGGTLIKIKSYQNIVFPGSGGFAVIESMDER